MHDYLLASDMIPWRVRMVDLNMPRMVHTRAVALCVFDTDSAGKLNCSYQCMQTPFSSDKGMSHFLEVFAVTFE